METSTEHTKRILLIDDQPVCKHGLERILCREGEFSIDGHAFDLNDALARHQEPNILSLDLAIARSRGISSIKDLRRRFPEATILVLTAHDELLFAERCLKAGAQGYLMKSESPEVVKLAFKEVASGHLHVSKRIRARLLNRVTGQGTADIGLRFDRLSDRELLIVQHISLSKNNREIADELQISTKTIESHRSRIKSKLELDSPSELVRFTTRLQSSLF